MHFNLCRLQIYFLSSQNGRAAAQSVTIVSNPGGPGLFLKDFIEICVGPSDIGTRFSETTSHLQADLSSTDANLIR
jgi:hypothetical protein